MDINQLHTQIKLVAELRASAQKAKAAQVEARVAWEIANEGILNLANFTAKNVEEAEAVLRELTLKVYAETGNKAPAPGVGIREITKLEYDPKKALEWAMEHQVALSLDKKSFEGFAKATPLEFVKVIHEPQATIATVLEVK